MSVLPRGKFPPLEKDAACGAPNWVARLVNTVLSTPPMMALMWVLSPCQPAPAPAELVALAERLPQVTLDPIYRAGGCRRPCQYVGFSFSDTPDEMRAMRQHGATAVGAGAMWNPTKDEKAPYGVGVRVPWPLMGPRSLGQSFRANHAFVGVALHTPTYSTAGSGCSLALYRLAPGEKAQPGDADLVARQGFTDVPDNAWLRLDVGRQPPGRYYLELSDVTGGRLGAWVRDGDPYEAGAAYLDRRRTAALDLEVRLLLRSGAAEDLVREAEDHVPLELEGGLFGALERLGMKTSFSVGNWNNGHFPYYPDWFHELYPDMAMLDQDGQPLLAGMFDRKVPWPGIDHPAIVDGTQRFIAATVEALRDEESLLSWVMGGEALYATYSFGGRWTDYQANAVTHYRRWLEREYGHLAALNEAYGSDWGSFDEVLPPREMAQDQHTLDWLDFRFRAMVERFQWHYAATREADPERYIFTCNHGTLFHGLKYAEQGADPELYAGVSDGYEMGQIMSDDDPDLYNLLWMTTAAVQGKPLAPVRLAYRKTTPGARGGGTSYTPQAAHRYFWESVGTGAWHLGFIQWRGSLPDGEWGVKGTPAQQELRQLLTDWPAIEHHFDDMWPYRPRVAIYCAHPTWALEGFSASWRDLHRLLVRRQIPVTWLFDEALANGEADRYDVVISLGNRFVSDQAADGLRDFVQQGGVLICQGPHGRLGEEAVQADRLIFGRRVAVYVDEYGIAHGSAGEGEVISLDDAIETAAAIRLAANTELCGELVRPLHIEVESDRPVTREYRFDTVGEAHDFPVDLSGHGWVGQEVLAPHELVHALSVCTPTWTNVIEGHSLRLEVRLGGPEGQLVAEKRIPAEEIADNSWHEIAVDREGKGGEVYYLRIIPPADLPPQTIGVWSRSGDAYAGDAHADGQPLSVDLRVAVKGQMRIPPREALEAFLLTDGLDFIVILNNISATDLRVSVALEPQLAPDPQAQYWAYEVLSGGQLGSAPLSKLAPTVVVPAHRGGAVCFERVTTSAEAHRAREALRQAVQRWRTRGALTPPIEADMARADEYLADGRPSRCLAAALRGLGQVGMRVRPGSLAAKAHGAIKLAVTVFDADGRPAPEADVEATFVPLFGHAESLESVGKGRFRLDVPVAELPWRYDYAERVYRPYHGPVEVVLSARAGGRSGQTRLLGRIGE